MPDSLATSGGGGGDGPGLSPSSIVGVVFGTFVGVIGFGWFVVLAFKSCCGLECCDSPNGCNNPDCCDSLEGAPSVIRSTDENGNRPVYVSTCTITTSLGGGGRAMI